MKSKFLREKPYSRLIRKVFFQTILILIAAIVLVFLIRSIGRGYFADAIVRIIMTFSHADWYEAVSFYHRYIRHNIDNIIMVTILIFFVTLFRFSLSWFTRYFDQIVAGVNQVIGYLSLLEEAPDMSAEQKAKYVHITLEKANRLEQLINEFFEITRYNFQSSS